MNPKTCTSFTDTQSKGKALIHCIHPYGHTGRHSDGDLSWENDRFDVCVPTAIEEIRARSALFGKGHRAQIVVSPYGQTESVRGIEEAYHQAPADIAFLLAEVDRLNTQQTRIKAALLVAGCADYTDDVAKMAEEYLAQPEEE